MHTFSQCMALIPWNNLHHECRSSLDKPLIRSRFSSTTSVRFNSSQSDASLRLPAGHIFNRFWQKLIDGLQDEGQKGTRSPCALAFLRPLLLIREGRGNLDFFFFKRVLVNVVYYSLQLGAFSILRYYRLLCFLIGVPCVTAWQKRAVTVKIGLPDNL